MHAGASLAWLASLIGHPGLFEAPAAPAGTVAIFREEGFPASGAASTGEVLAGALRAAGLDVRFLDAAELADPAKLAPGSIDIAVLPYGRSFPAPARDNFLAYLRGGGDFISTGGYAFLDLLLKDGGRWEPEGAVLRRRLDETMKSGPSLLADGGF